MKDKIEKLEDVLKTIMLNTINREFNDNKMYKSGVLSHIEIAVGKEKFEEWEKIYKLEKL